MNQGGGGIDSLNVSVDFSTYNKMYPNNKNTNFTLRNALNQTMNYSSKHQTRAPLIQSINKPDFRTTCDTTTNNLKRR